MKYYADSSQKFDFNKITLFIDDHFVGGDGRDTASYYDAANAVMVALSTGTASGGGGNDNLVALHNGEMN